MKTILALAAAAAAISAAPAAAQPSALEDSYSVSIPYGDLNLNSAKGLSILQRRIDGGSEGVCSRRDRHNMNQWGNIDRCRQHFLAEAQQQVDLLTRKRSVTVVGASK